MLSLLVPSHSHIYFFLQFSFWCKRFSKLSFLNFGLKRITIRIIQWIYITWGRRPFLGTNETTFQFCFKEILYQVGLMRWRSILSKYLIIMFNNFFGRRKQLLTQTSAIVFFINFDTNVTYKKGFVIPYHKIAADVMTFLVILFVEPSKFSSGISGFFLYYIRDRSADWQELKGWNIFHHAKLFFRSYRFSNLSLREPEGLCSVLSTSTHFCCFQALEQFKNFLSYHSLYCWPTDSCLFGNFSWC